MLLLLYSSSEKYCAAGCVIVSAYFPPCIICTRCSIRSLLRPAIRISTRRTFHNFKLRKHRSFEAFAVTAVPLQTDLRPSSPLPSTVFIQTFLPLSFRHPLFDPNQSRVGPWYPLQRRHQWRGIPGTKGRGVGVGLSPQLTCARQG